MAIIALMTKTKINQNTDTATSSPLGNGCQPYYSLIFSQIKLLETGYTNKILKNIEVTIKILVDPHFQIFTTDIIKTGTDLCDHMRDRDLAKH
ncbi:hypothetical protein CVS40_8401 [Lucilia cuprina]|nr:hypothetical protein CVS40_8401 [Lucilia cuprina]